MGVLWFFVSLAAALCAVVAGLLVNEALDARSGVDPTPWSDDEDDVPSVPSKDFPLDFLIAVIAVSVMLVAACAVSCVFTCCCRKKKKTRVPPCLRPCCCCCPV